MKWCPPSSDKPPPLHSDPEAFLAAAGRQLARLFARDTRRLDALLRSLHP